jgi:hypothetical protein
MRAKLNSPNRTTLHPDSSTTRVSERPSGIANSNRTILVLAWK